MAYMDMKIKLLSYLYHRNGVSGAPFFVVEFRDHTPGEGLHKLTAIVPKDVVDEYAANPKHRFAGGDQVYVIERDNIDSKWRGDNFAPLVLDQLVAKLREDGEL